MLPKFERVWEQISMVGITLKEAFKSSKVNINNEMNSVKEEIYSFEEIRQVEIMKVWIPG